MELPVFQFGLPSASAMLRCLCVRFTWIVKVLFISSWKSQSGPEKLSQPWEQYLRSREGVCQVGRQVFHTEGAVERMSGLRSGGSVQCGARPPLVLARLTGSAGGAGFEESHAVDLLPWRLRRPWRQAPGVEAASVLSCLQIF